MSITDVTPPDPRPPNSPTRRRRNFALVTGASTMDNTEQSIISVLYPSVQAALGLTLSALGTLVASTKLIGVVFGPLWVVLARRTNRRVVLATCSGLWGVWIVAAGFSQNYYQLLVLYIIAAAGFSGAAPIVSEILGDLYPDARRGRAVGYMYGMVALITAASGPIFGQLSRFENGWRYGYFISGSICILLGLLILLTFKDPGLGATEMYRARPDTAGIKPASTLEDLRELLKNRTIVLILVQRLLSSQALLMGFGVVYLVDVFGFTNATAALVALPYGVGYFAGTVTGGMAVDRLHRRFPQRGRIAFLQVTQFLFVAVAFAATQLDWGSIAIFSVFFAMLGALAGVNPVVRAPLVMAVVRPELRGMAFALLISVVESLVWAVYSLSAGALGDAIGLQTTFLFLLVGITFAGAVFASFLYRPYLRDSEALKRATALHMPSPPATV